MIYDIDERRLIALPGNAEETVQFAVDHFIECGQEAIEDHGAFYVALSGGSTPKKIYQLLASPKYREALDYKKVYFFFSDERSVPPTDQESNYKMALESGIEKLKTPHDQIFRMKADIDIDEGAREYEALIRKKLNHHPFDYIMLGMGDDGHTASLFPHTKALEILDQLVVANDVPQKKTKRMTFTLSLINQANNIVIYVIGENKKERLKEALLDRHSNLPSSRVGTDSHPSLWIVDEAASKDLLKEFIPKERRQDTI